LVSISSSWDLASDAELITAVRTGESAAFGVLYERHSAAARAVAHQYSNSAADAEDAAADAFQRVFATIQGGGGPDVAFRAYLFTVVRRVAMDRVHVGRRVQATDDLEAFEEAFGAAESSEDPTFAGFERSVVSRAYKSLPERWQAVLWYTEVEGLNPAEIAPVLGLTANGVAALAYRAREGLRQAYLQQHLAAPASEACTIVSSKLGAYVRGGLAKRETALVEMHLEECGDCRALVLELGDVNHGLRAIIAPLVLGAIGVGVLQGIGFGGAAGAVGAAAAAAGAGAGAGAGVGSGGAAVGSGGGVGVGVGAGAGGAGAAAGGSGAAAGAGSLVGAGAGLSAAASGVAAVGGAAALAASFGALQPAAASTSLTSGATGTAGGVVAGGAAGSTAAAASTTGLAALVAGLPVTAIGLAAAGVIVAGAVAVAGTLGLFSPDDGSPDIVASEPELPDPGTDQGVDEGPDEGTEGDTTPDPADVVPPADPTNIPPVDDGTDNGSEPATVTPPTTAPTTPPTSTPTPTTEPTTPPTPPDPTPAELVVTPTTLTSFVAGQEQIIPIGVANDGEQSAGVVHTELSFPTGTDVVVSALATPSGGGLARTIVPSTDWSCAPVSGTGEVTFTCTLPDLPANAESKLFAGVTITDDIDGERDIAFGVRTWAPALGAAPVATPMSTRVASPATRITVGAVPAARLAGVTGDFATTGVTVPVINTGTHAPAFVEVTGLPANVGVTWSAGWTCTRAATLVCAYPDLKRNETANLVLTLADTAALVDVDTTVTGPVTVTATGPTNAVAFDLAITSAPGAVDVEPPAMTTLQRNVARGVSMAVSNEGRTTARDLVIEVDLPESVSWYSSLHVVTDWTCVAGNGSNVDVRCTLPALAPGASSDLVVPVQTAAGTLHGDIVVRSLTGATTGPWSSPVRVVTSALVFSSPVTADLIRGASGPIAFAITNTGEAPAFHVSATITVPRSVSFDELSAMPGEGSGWRCTRVSPQRLTCLLVSGRLDPGESAAAVVHATAEAAIAKQSVAVEVVDGLGADAAVLTSSVEVNVPDAGLAPRGRWTGGYGVTEIGAPLLGCRGTSSAWCAAMSELGGGAQNNSYDMIIGASTSQLTIPANSDVAFAGLYWSANKYATDAWTGSQTQLALRGPGGVAQTIEGELIANVEDNANRDYYQSFADVTDLVRAGGSGSWSADGAAVALTRNDPNPSYYAGWSLVVVYTTPYEPEQNVTVYDGGAWVAANKSATFAFEAGADRDGRIGVVAWDGDRGNTGDTLGLNGTSLQPRRWDGSLGSANDAFTSTATGSLYANSLGVDAKAFGSGRLLDGINRLTASTGGDQYLIGAVTVQSSPR
jgi:RNA polymerase sigma factor (sigma-70 family)